ncbi:tyrosine protein kinase [Paenibacillus sp. JJ-223]|uniref:tyrosine protein kinase n=1 Tax=Paenibacillus sp. JJ-223 TaxID=2905647 RepID=UPI001F256382|nr:tyrosine protein kinase [Paenibacillus sp. JJ-223]CAH1221833.1 hypothetical protein PAECIP111890_05300 [Paenibacillus sp. JJ-223]
MPQHYYHRPPAPRQRPSSKHHRANTSAYAPAQRALTDGETQSMYPGVEPQFSFGQAEASSIVPYGQNAPGESFYGSGSGSSGPAVPVQNSSASGSTGFSLANLGELKGMIDRFGGIDGIISGIGKMQKVVGSIQQMAPMVKLFMGMLPFGKSKTTNDSSAAEKDYEDYTSPRRRKRKSGKKSSGTTRRQKSNPAKRRPKSSKR